MKKLPLSSKQLVYLSILLSGFNLAIFGLPHVLFAFKIQTEYIAFLFQDPFYHIFAFRHLFFLANAFILFYHYKDFSKKKTKKSDYSSGAMEGPEIQSGPSDKNLFMISAVLFGAALISSYVFRNFLIFFQRCRQLADPIFIQIVYFMEKSLEFWLNILLTVKTILGEYNRIKKNNSRIMLKSG